MLLGHHVSYMTFYDIKYPSVEYLIIIPQLESFVNTLFKNN
jgi:hypothetical protein